MDSAGLLTGIPFFHGLNREQLTSICAAAGARRVAAGGSYFHQGDPAHTYYVLRKGRVRISQLTPEGNQVTLHIVSPGELFGMIAAVGGGEFPATAEAIEDCEALSWDSDTMWALMAAHAPLALNALQVVSRRLHEMQDRYRELATERVERRIARAVLRLARQAGRRTPDGILIDLPLSRQDLAELTGTTLYTVSRTLTAWDQAGIVAAGRERLLILKPHAFVTIAEDLPQD
jgi:CRP/FNR family transcriptional regulator, nitrogen oxide reductase regulator